MATLAPRVAPAVTELRSPVAVQIACAAVGAALVSGLARFAPCLPCTPAPITGLRQTAWRLLERYEPKERPAG
jgi:hypothetical protein